MLCFSTHIKVGTLCIKNHQVLRLEHRLGLMEILKKLKRNIFVEKKNYFIFFGEKYIFAAIYFSEFMALAKLTKLMAREC